MEEKASLEPQTQKLIKTYTTVYKIVFQYSFFVIPLIAGLIIALFLQSRDIILQKKINTTFKQVTYTVANGMYTPAKVSDQVGPIFDGLGDIKILGGDLQATGNVLIGRNNIISLNGIILPDQQYIIDFGFSGGVSYFKQDYDINTLVRVLNNWILSIPPTSANDKDSSSVINDTFFRENKKEQTNMEQILSILMERKYFMNMDSINNNRQQETNKNNLISEYDLSCTLKPKVYDGFCNKNIEYFIQHLPTIDLQNKRNDLFTIANGLKKEDHIDGFCANLMYNVFKQPYPSSNLDIIMNGVCKEYNTRYSQIKDFLKIENQLMGIMTEDVINNNLVANLFKLTSLWQKIIIQSKNKTFDSNLIITYIQFFNNLLHQDTVNIPQFYIDAGYYFNNVYLKNIVKQESALSTNSAVKNDATNILDKINSLNKGNDTIGVKGLEQMIQNTKLKELTVIRSNNSSIQLQNLQQVFIEYLRGYPEFGIDKAEVDTNTRVCRVLGTLRYKTDNKLQQESIIATFDYTDNQFILSSSRLPNNGPLDKILIGFSSHNKSISFSDVIEFIKNNGDYKPTTITMCSILSGQNNVKISSCSDTQVNIVIEKTPVVLTLSNNIATNITTTNKQWNTYLQNHIKQYGSVGIDTVIKVLDTMKNVSENNKNTTGEELSSIEIERIAIVGKFKQHLGVEPNELVEQNGKRLVSFTLQGYSLGTLVEIKKNYKMSPLVVQVNGKIISVPGFSLSLIPFMQTAIDQFVRDPLNYIKNIDTAAYQKIQYELQPKK